MTDGQKKVLAINACKVRMGIIEATHAARSGHPGGSLSAADLFTYLYFKELNVAPTDPKGEDRDRFVLSKGHTAPGLYAALALRGFFPQEDLLTLRHIGSHLQGHPNMNTTPGVDMSTGSLGQGISAACGMALAAKHLGNPCRVYTLLGDGEIQEGQPWEAFMFAHHYKLDNLCVIIDNNHLQIDGPVEEVMTYVMLGDGEIQEGMVWEAAMAANHHDLKNLVAIVDCNGVQINGWVNEIMTVEPLADKWRSFGWSVVECNGHNMKDVLTALHTAKTMRHPTVILMRTVKGKGVSFMEDESKWHGSAPSDEEMVKAISEIKEGGVV